MGVNMRQEFIEQLETPCLVIDMACVKRNIDRMQQAASAGDCALRPHIKTHKMPLFAHMQIEAGAAGITCAKVSEAEVMAEGGIDDIFIAYPMVGGFRIRRAIALAKKIRRLILAVDSPEGARMLDDAARKTGLVLEVRLEIDIGAGRTGVPPDQAVALAKLISDLPSLRLTGIYAFKGLVYKGAPTQDIKLAAEEEGARMHRLAAEIKEAGIPVTDVSAGSTPTGAALAKLRQVSEIRPGTYIFGDYMLYREGAIRFDQIAARYYATVVSVSDNGYAVIDGGTKTFSADIPLHEPPYDYPGYAIVEGRQDLVLDRMNEEHGMLSARSGTTGLQVGDIVTLIPLHICTAVNLQNTVYLDYGDRLVKEKVKARGMLV